MPKPESEPIRPSMKEEAGIRTGIEADPDTLDLDGEWFAKARSASETHPHIVERYRRWRGKQGTPAKGTCLHPVGRRSGRPFSRQRAGVAVAIERRPASSGLRPSGLMLGLPLA